MLDTAIYILNKIKENGYEALIVGGYVRDKLLNIISSDIDISTNVDTKVLYKLFNVISDNKYGSFVIECNNYQFEITLYRKELSYTKQRHPEVVFVNSYKDDYIRRDFTINALAYDCNLNIVDYCNGLSDIKDKLIKTIRNCNETFIEDPVRILRALYFKNKLGLSYDLDTYNSLINNVEHLNVISNMRVITELTKMCYNFDLYSDDLILTKVYENIYFKEAIEYIHTNKIKIENINNLFEIQYHLTNKLNIDISNKVKKEIISYINCVDKPLTNRFVFDISSEVFSKINKFNMLLKRNCKIDEYNKIRSNLVINSINEIDFDLSSLKNFIDYKNINIVKELILNNILDKKLENNYEDIIKFVNYIKV